MKPEKILKSLEELKGLNPKEYYNWPFGIHMAIGSVLMVIVFVIGVFVDLLPMTNELESIANKEEELKKEFIDKKKQAVNLSLYEEQLVFITKDSNNLLKQLPDKSQMEKLLIDINQAAVSRGLQVELFKPNQEKINDFYAELPINVKVFGDYEAIGNFTADVSRLSRVVIFSNMEIKTEKNTVSLTALLKTFRYLDQSELEEQARKIAEEKKKKKKQAQQAEAPSKGGH